MRRVLMLATLILLNLTLTSRAQRTYILNGVAYVFPSSQGAANEVLSAVDGAGTLDWVAQPASSGWATGLVVFTPSGTCPAGWSEYTAARGRYILGLPSGGSNAATVGTALTNAEDRVAGQHLHTVSDPGHTHPQDAHTHGVGDGGHTHGGSLGAAAVSIDTGGNDGVSNQAGTTGTTSANVNVSVGTATATNASTTTGLALGNAGNVASTNAPYLQLKACQAP